MLDLLCDDAQKIVVLGHVSLRVQGIAIDRIGHHRLIPSHRRGFSAAPDVIGVSSPRCCGPYLRTLTIRGRSPLVEVFRSRRALCETTDIEDTTRVQSERATSQSDSKRKLPLRRSVHHFFTPPSGKLRTKLGPSRGVPFARVLPPDAQTKDGNSRKTKSKSTGWRSSLALQREACSVTDGTSLWQPI